MFAAGDYPISVVSAKPFERDASACLSELEIERLEDFLAYNPEAGDIIPGTGGVRKFRWRYGVKGKRGGCRVVYYFRDLNMPLFLLAIYKKGEKADLSARDRKAIQDLVNDLVLSYSHKWFRIVRDQMA